MIRDDISSLLIHLTSGTDETASQKLLSILNQGKLLGSNSNIRGKYKCICFTETPISKFPIPLVLNEQKLQEMRYRPFGVMVSKDWLFSKGGRQAIYQTNEEFDELPESKRYLHVRYNPQEISDYSWEREWRIRIDELPLNPNETTVIVPNRSWEEKINKDHTAIQQEKLRNISSKFGGFPHIPPKWHFICLEDLGIKIPLNN
jgi:hypothetical protein